MTALSRRDLGYSECAKLDEFFLAGARTLGLVELRGCLVTLDISMIWCTRFLLYIDRCRRKDDEATFPVPQHFPQIGIGSADSPL